MCSVNFFLVIRLRGAPATPPSGKRLRRRLEQWLATLDPDEIGHQLVSQGFDSLPSLPWSHGGWDLEFIPIPKPAAVRGSPGLRPIGTTLPEMTRITHPSIGKAIRAKATKYGKVNLPFVVGVNVIDVFMQNVNILRYQGINELFGEVIGIDTLRPDGTIDRRTARKPNGAWSGPHGPRNKGVSAALIVVGLDPWTIANRTPVMIHNPWATCPFPLDQWPLLQWAPNLHDDCIHERLGKSVAEVLSIPDSWPPIDDA
jgi:hypothetical protein